MIPNIRTTHQHSNVNRCNKRFLGEGIKMTEITKGTHLVENEQAWSQLAAARIAIWEKIFNSFDLSLTDHIRYIYRFGCHDVNKKI